MNKLIVFVFVAFGLLLPFVSSEEVVRDVELTFIVDVELNETYDSFLRLENLDHETGRSDSLDVNVSITLRTSNSTIMNRSVVRTLNKFTETGMGSLIITKNETHELCANFTPLNFVDYNTTNNGFCENISFDPINITETNTTDDIEKDSCDCDFEVSAPRIINSSTTMPISIDWCVEDSSYTQNVSYWVEDMQGNIVKTNLTTINPSTKQYTPTTSKPDKTLKVKASVKKCNASTYTLSTVVNQDLKVQEKSVLSLEAEVDENQVSLKLFGFKNDTNREVINVYFEEDGERVTNLYKYYVREKNTAFDMQSILQPNLPSATYTLVAEGFGLKDTTNVEVYVESEEYTCEALSLIQSFYTRQRLFANEINVFFNVEDTADKVILHSSLDSVDVTGLTTHQVTITNENDILFLEARKDEKSDHAILRLDLETKQEPTKTLEEKNTENNTNQANTNTSDEDIHITFSPQTTDTKNNYSYFLIGFATLILFYKELRNFTKKIWIKYLNEPKL